MPDIYVGFGDTGLPGHPNGHYTIVNNAWVGQSSTWMLIQKGWVGQSGSWVLTYDATPGALATIVVTPSSASIPAGGTQTFVAQGFDAHSRPVTITPTWSLSTFTDSIDSFGVFTAGSRPDSGTVTATVGAVSGSASYSVV